MAWRIERINSLLRKEISQILLKEIDFGSIFVTLTEVKTTPDLIKARILITTHPEKGEKEALSILQKNIYQIQKKINKKLKMKIVPKIQFEIDKGMKNLYKIDELGSHKT